MQIRKEFVGAAVALALWAGAAGAQTATAGLPGEWLERYTTARALALGGAFVAGADDPLGAAWNPAGIAFLNQDALSFENARLFGEASLNALSFAVPGNRLPSFGMSAIALGSDGFERTNETNDALGTFHEGQTAYLFTLAKHLSPRFSVGAGARLVQQTVEDYSAQGMGYDLGALLWVTPAIRVGASVANLGGPGLRLRDVDETYPVLARAGACAAVFGGRGIVSAEMSRAGGDVARLHGGAEYWILSGFAARLGYDADHATGGFGYRFAPQYQLDYAVTDQALGLSHRVGLSYRFGGFHATARANPEMFSPTGDHAVTKLLLNARTKSDPASWELAIVNKGDEVVRRFGGAGQPPSHVEWDGKDETGLPLPDGVYRYTLTVKDKAGRSLASPVCHLEIQTEGPRVLAPVVTTP